MALVLLLQLEEVQMAEFSNRKVEYQLAPLNLKSLFDIPVSNVMNMSSHAKNCSVVVDLSVLIACEDGFHMLEETIKFLYSDIYPLKESKVLSLDGKGSLMRSSGNFSIFVNPGTGHYNFYKLLGSGKYQYADYKAEVDPSYSNSTVTNFKNGIQVDEYIFFLIH